MQAGCRRFDSCHLHHFLRGFHHGKHVSCRHRQSQGRSPSPCVGFMEPILLLRAIPSGRVALAARPSRIGFRTRQNACGRLVDLGDVRGTKHTAALSRGAGQQSGRTSPAQRLCAQTLATLAANRRKRGLFPGCSAVVARLFWEQDVAGSIPATPTISGFTAPVAQGIERPPPKRQVARSTRAGRTSLVARLTPSGIPVRARDGHQQNRFAEMVEWQTHHAQNVAPKGMRVRPSLSAPRQPCFCPDFSAPMVE